MTGQYFRPAAIAELVPVAKAVKLTQLVTANLDIVEKY